MSDYIKRNVALDAMRDVMKQAKHLRPPLYDAIDNVKNLPSADVAEVKHGRWIKSKAGGVLCSECYSYAPYVEKGSFTTKRIEQAKSAYCPNCGARMDGGNDE